MKNTTSKSQLVYIIQITFYQYFSLKSIYQDSLLYRVSIKSFPDYKHLLQENYVEYKYIFFNVTQLKKF